MSRGSANSENMTFGIGPAAHGWGFFKRRFWGVYVRRLHVARERGYPVVVDNGPELRGRAMDGWADDHGVQLYFIDPGKPTQNAYIESFNGRYREECLNQHWFTSIGEAREIIEEWRIDYNTERPHSSLKYQTPEEFAAARPFDKTQWAQPLELLDGSAPAPIAHAAE